MQVFGKSIYIYDIYILYIYYVKFQTTTKMTSFNQDPLRVQPFLSKVFEVPMANSKIIPCEQWQKKPVALGYFWGWNPTQLCGDYIHGKV